MENSTYQQEPSWNNLVFENRNKAFGAYRLRLEYNRNVIVGLFTCAAFIGLIFSIPTLLAMIGINSKPIIKSPIDLTTVIVNPPKIIPITPPIKPTVPAVKMKNPNLVPFVTAEPVMDEPVPPIEPTEVDLPTTNAATLSTETSLPVEMPKLIEQKTVFVFAEQMPAYCGGLESLYKFLSKNLRYPAIDRRNGTEGTVYVQFVINEIGEISNVEVFRGVSATLDNEAARVISTMKQWTPGKQNGQPVSVRMILPVKFKLTT